MKKSHSENTVGPWAKEKLDALEKYLKYYCSVLKNQGFTLVYVDGFAGAPVTTIRQSSTRSQVSELWSEAGIDDFKDIDEFVLGSPIRSLNINPGFDRHYFFDLDDRRVAELETLKPSWPDKWVHIETGDANKRIRKLISKIGHRREVRGVAFLDPYGPNLEWQTVVDLAASKRFEVIINLPIHMALNRLLMKDSQRRPDWEEMVDRCFGTTDWREITYPKTTDLFGDTLTPKADGVPELLLQMYVKRLREIFPEVATPRLIRNTKNSPLYYLIWAGPHRKGLVGAEYVLGHGEKLAKKNR